jgi:hypothetical protein
MQATSVTLVLVVAKSVLVTLILMHPTMKYLLRASWSGFAFRLHRRSSGGAAKRSSDMQREMAAGQTMEFQ